MAELRQELLRQNQAESVMQERLDTMQQSMERIEAAVNAALDGSSMDAKMMLGLANSMAEIRRYSLGAACASALAAGIVLDADPADVFHAFTNRPGTDCVLGAAPTSAH